MQADQALKDHIEQKLREALDRVRRDIEKVDIWAGAFTAFLRPVPDYQMSDRFLLPVRHQNDRNSDDAHSRQH